MVYGVAVIVKGRRELFSAIPRLSELKEKQMSVDTFHEPAAMLPFYKSYKYLTSVLVSLV